MVAELVQKHGSREEIEFFLVDLLRSRQSFDQIIALEYLESPDYQSLRKSLESDIENISESENPALKQKALFIKSLDKKNTKKVVETNSAPSDAEAPAQSVATNTGSITEYSGRVPSNSVIAADAAPVSEDKVEPDGQTPRPFLWLALLGVGGLAALSWRVARKR